MFFTDTDKEIISGLIKSCLTIDPSIFFPYLKHKNLVTNMPNKMRFYRFYVHMINCLNCNSNKKLHYEWKRTYWMKEKKISLQIFDDIHKFERLTFILEKKKGKLYIQTLPF